MNIYQSVKQSVSARQAASFYGISVSKNGMACCPFHDDRHPSMKIDERFFCFGCGEKGDVIDFVAKLHDERLPDAARRIANDFDIDVSAVAIPRMKPAVAGRTHPPRDVDVTDLVRKTTERYYDTLCRFSRMFRSSMEQLAPKTPEDTWHPLFVMALDHGSYVDHLLDTLFYGEWEEKLAILDDCRKEIEEIDAKLDAFIYFMGQPSGGASKRNHGAHRKSDTER